MKNKDAHRQEDKLMSLPDKLQSKIRTEIFSKGIDFSKHSFGKELRKAFKRHNV